MAVGSIEFVERIRKLVKGDPREQPDVRQWQRMTPFKKVIGALERVRGESWEELKDRRGDDAKGLPCCWVGVIAA